MSVYLLKRAQSPLGLTTAYRQVPQRLAAAAAEAEAAAATRAGGGGAAAAAEAEAAPAISISDGHHPKRSWCLWRCWIPLASQSLSASCNNNNYSLHSKTANISQGKRTSANDDDGGGKGPRLSAMMRYQHFIFFSPCR